MTKELTACRVCGGTLVGYYGLCASHQADTVRFWARLRRNIEDRKREAERLRKAGVAS